MFVLNKELTIVEKITMEEVIPGKAAMLTIPWNNDKKLRILNIYAPNDPTDSGNFWREITAEIERKKLQCPSVILGDFNIVDDSLDRLPNKADNMTQ